MDEAAYIRKALYFRDLLEYIGNNSYTRSFARIKGIHDQKDYISYIDDLRISINGEIKSLTKLSEQLEEELRLNGVNL